MKIAFLGGGGAMGGLFGGYLARSGEDVFLVDVSQASVDAINRDGLAIEEKDGSTETVRVKASSNPSDIGPVDLIVNFVKCYNTEAAIKAAAPMLGADTSILTLQNGWGNADRIAAVVGRARVMVGLTYHSGTLLGPGPRETFRNWNHSRGRTRRLAVAATSNRGRGLSQGRHRDKLVITHH